MPIDDMMDNDLHFFQSWKKSKYDKLHSNTQERQLLDQIDSQDPAELDEANEGEDPLEVSETEGSDVEEPAAPTEDVFTCYICYYASDQWRTFEPCGHMFCLKCCEKMYTTTGQCGCCKLKIKKMHKSYTNFLFASRSRKLNTKGEKSQEERRRENALQMRRLSGLPEEEEEEEEEEEGGENEGDEGIPDNAAPPNAHPTGLVPLRNLVRSRLYRQPGRSQQHNQLEQETGTSTHTYTM